jgi:hypothetical protein
MSNHVSVRCGGAGASAKLPDIEDAMATMIDSNADFLMRAVLATSLTRGLPGRDATGDTTDDVEVKLTVEPS